MRDTMQRLMNFGRNLMQLPVKVVQYFISKNTVNLDFSNMKQRDIGSREPSDSDNDSRYESAKIYTKFHLKRQVKPVDENPSLIKPLKKENSKPNYRF